MAILQKVRIQSNERLDSPDFENLSNFVCNDFSQMFRGLFNATSYIVKGFELYDSTGLLQLQVEQTNMNVKIGVAGAMLLHTNKLTGPIMYIGASSLAKESLTLTLNNTNYIEVDITTYSGTSDTRAFWDPSANAGQGAEFTAIIDTVTYIKAAMTVSTTGWSGGTKLPVAEVKADGTKVVAIYDRRNLLFRLGKAYPYNHDYEYPWTQGRIESAHLLKLGGIAGTFNAGETVSGGTSLATAEVISWGSPTLTVSNKSLASFTIGETITGPSGSGTLLTVEESFASADKSISDFKTLINAILTEIKWIKGSNFWFEDKAFSFAHLFLDLALMTITGNGRVEHDTAVTGKLTWPDLKLKPITSSVIYTVPASNMTLANGDVLYIDINEGGNRGVTGNRTMVQVARNAVPFNGNIYWIAFRDDNGGDPAIYFRNVGLLQPGEAQQVGEEGEKDFIVDRNVKLIKGGSWTWEPLTNTLAWSEDAYLQVPGLADSRNRIAAASTTILDADDKVLYVDINRSAGAPAVLSLAAAAVASFVPSQHRFVIARRLSSTQVLVNEESVKFNYMIDRNCKLVRGGIWTWDLGSTTLSWSSNAYIQVPGLSESVNQIDAGSSAALDADGKVLYVSINRKAPGGSLAVNGAAIGSVVNNPDLFIIARRIGDTVVVGSHSQAIKDRQFVILEDVDNLANDSRCRAVATSPISKDIKVWPSQRDSNGKKVYSYILPTLSSKFPRLAYATGIYDGGTSHNRLVTISFSDSVANVVTVTATGPTFGAQTIGTFTTNAVNCFTPVTIFINPDDTLSIAAGSNYLTSGSAADDDALPPGGASQFPICTVIHERDVGGTTQTISNSEILERRKFGGAGGGSGEGGGLGSNLADLPYLMEWSDSFEDETLVDSSSGYTNAAYNIVTKSYSLSFESKTQAGWTMSGTGAGGDPVLIVGAPAFTVDIGDVIAAIFNEATSTINGAPVDNILIAAGAIFTVAMVGRRVRNTTTADDAIIIGFTNANTVTLDRDIDGADLTWANGNSIYVDSKPSVRKIITVNSQTSFVTESIFGANLNTCVMACISQCVHTVDIPLYFDSADAESIPAAFGVGHIKLNSLGDGNPVHFRDNREAPAVNDIVYEYAGGWLETFVTGLVDQNSFNLNAIGGWSDSNQHALLKPQTLYMVNYDDSAGVDKPAIMFQAITGSNTATNWDTEYGRKRKNNPLLPVAEQVLDDQTKAGGHFYLRFFANSLEAAASGSKKLYKYESWWYRESANAESGIHQQAYGMTSNIGSANNKHMTVSVSGGKTRIVLDWGYVVGVNPGESYGELEIMLDAEEIPRYVNATITPGAYYTEVNAVTIDLDQDYSGFSFEIGVRVKYGSEDVSNQNSNKLAKLYDAIVGTTDGCTHSTLAAAITACPAGGRILVNNETFTITGALVTVNKDNITIEGKGRGALFDSDDTAVGITISNPGCIIRNIKLKDFTTAIDVNAEKCMIVQNWFESNTTDVDTAGAVICLVDENISE